MIDIRSQEDPWTLGATTEWVVSVQGIDIANFLSEKEAREFVQSPGFTIHSEETHYPGMFRITINGVLVSMVFGAEETVKSVARLQKVLDVAVSR